MENCINHRDRSEKLNFPKCIYRQWRRGRETHDFIPKQFDYRWLPFSLLTLSDRDRLDIDLELEMTEVVGGPLIKVGTFY